MRIKQEVKDILGYNAEAIAKVDGYPVVLIPNTGFMPFVAMAMFEHDTILIDAHFYEFSEATRHFIMQHEIGHLKDQKLKAMSALELETRRALFIQCQVILPEEQYADEYAYARVGEDAITALEEIEAFFSTYADTWELKKRIAHITTLAYGKQEETPVLTVMERIINTIKGGVKHVR